MIRSFRDAETEEVFDGIHSKKFSAIEKVARRKLVQIDSAETLDELRAIPGNRFEALAKDRKGQYSIRVNDQYRICFEWTESDASNVELVDYH